MAGKGRSGVPETLQELESRSRELDTSPPELGAWLERVAKFSADYLEGNVAGPAFLGYGAGPPTHSPLPTKPTPFPEVLEEFRDLALTRGLVPTSGRFFGYIPGGGLASAALGDYVAAITNRYAGFFAASPGAVQVENSTIRWLCEMIGYPESAWGTLQSGGSLATVTAVVAARETRPHEQWPRSVVYFTEECHLAIRKALHITGLAHIHARTVPVDGALRMSAGDLGQIIERDRREGLLPWMVFASAGTLNTGAVDPLEAIAEIASREKLWFHVDAAYGGFFVLTKRAGGALAPMARADSVVLDPHKALFLPYGCGAVLVREGELLRRAFAFSSSYLSHGFEEARSPADFSPELTRHFRGLRLWMSLKIHGLERFRAALEEKLLLAEIAQRRLARIPAIEVGPPPELSCVAFRVRGEDDGATERLLERIRARGRVHMSSTMLWGKPYIRICVLCFRSHWEDVAAALEEIEEGML